MERVEIVFKHDVKTKIRDLKRKSMHGAGASRTGSKQSHDSYYISSPYLSDKPLTTMEGLLAQCNGNDMDNSVMDRFLQAFGYIPPNPVALLEHEWKSAIFPNGKEQYVQVCLASQHYMRMHLVRKEKQKLLTFSGFRSVASIDSRNKTNMIVSHLPVRLALDQRISTDLGDVLCIPGFAMPEFDQLKKQFKAGKYKMIFLKGA
jgi:hypothetical protein